MRVLILSDSLALPRSTPEQVAFEETWVELLRKNTSLTVHQVSIGGATIDVLWQQFGYHKLFNPDIIIIQCGIVDCAPRSLTISEETLINSNKLTRWLGRKILPRTKNVLRKYRSIKRTQIAKFNSYLEKFNSTGAKVFFIEIIDSGEKYDKIVPGISSSIKKYNGSIATIGKNLISTASISYDCLMDDMHHLNRQGHFKLYRAVAEKIFQSPNPS
jgi:hypothetical protein